MIVFTRSSLIERDVRAQKYMHYLGKENYLVIHWDREDEYQNSDPNVFTFKYPIKSGLKIKNIFKFLKWNWFLFYTLFQNINRIDFIQVTDLDSFPATIIYKLMGKKIIFDVYDFFFCAKYQKPHPLLVKFEMMMMNMADVIILPMEFRTRYLTFVPKELFICENVPLITRFIPKVLTFNDHRIHIVYAGTLEKDQRGLEWIPYLAQKLENKVHFTIAGFGQLSDFFEQAAKTHSNIDFKGRITPEMALEVQSQSHLIYAVYRTTVHNNVMAAPNKFYESLFLGRPLLTNQGLNLSELISEQDLGYVAEESQEGMLKVLETIIQTDIAQKAQKSTHYWSKNYHQYLDQKYGDEYFKLINKTNKINAMQNPEMT